MRRLLIVSCSKLKKTLRGGLPAIERYDGPTFQVIRKYLRETKDTALSVLVLSAKYGLIDASDRIPNYDRRLTAQAARKFQTTALVKIRRRLVRFGRGDGVGVCLGRDYRPAVQGLEQILSAGIRLEFIGGGRARRLTNLRAWLREEHFPDNGRRREGPIHADDSTADKMSRTGRSPHVER